MGKEWGNVFVGLLASRPCLEPSLRAKEGFSLLRKFNGFPIERFWSFFLVVLGMEPGTLLHSELGSASESDSQPWESFRWEAEVKENWFSVHCEAIVPLVEAVSPHCMSTACALSQAQSCHGGSGPWCPPPPAKNILNAIT